MVDIREVLNENPGDFRAVRPGEVCSIETAKALGVFDAAQYYAKDANMGDTRTFGDKVKGDAARPYRLCDEVAADNAATPLCPLVGPGMEASGAGQCAFPECPTGFTPAGKGVCKKPVVANAVAKASRCDAQWHDWFTVPNAHMGNGYALVNKTCRAPCPDSAMPAVGTDPLTDKVRGGTDEAKCVDKLEYLGGKFGDDSDFCTVAWVKRIASSASTVAEENRQRYPQFIMSGSKRVRAEADAAAAKVARSAHARLENLDADTPSMQMLCKRVETPERLADAYKTCAGVLEGGDERGLRAYGERVRASFPGLSEQDVRRRWRMLNQACHHTFCDTTSGGDRAYRVGQPSLCFPAESIARMDMSGRALPAAPVAPKMADSTPAPEVPDSAANLSGWWARVTSGVTNLSLAIVSVLLIGLFVYYSIEALRRNTYADEITETATNMVRIQRKGTD